MKTTSKSDLAGKVALLTGAAKGIGADIARAYAAEGIRLVINYRASEDAARALCAEIVSAGGEAIPVRGDITEAEDVARLVRATLDRYGRIDVLVNNAAAYRYESAAEITRESFRAQFEVNVLGLLLVTQAVAPHLPRGGRVINLSSISARLATPGVSVYSGTKAAVNAITRTLAAELGPRGISVNGIAPGSTETATNEWLTEEKKEIVRGRTALGRVGTGRDVANAAIFFASPASDFITGEVLTVDGGYFG